MSHPQASSEKRADVAICVASYRRPEGLRALLGGIGNLVFEGEAPGICVHVADNDAAGSARGVVEDAREWLAYPVEYVLEPRTGIPQARNATLRSALGTAAWLVFVDDDEVPDPHWLARLLETQRASGADVVTGPVIARFEEPAPTWVVEGGFFDAPRAATGSEVNTAYTNNAMVRSDALAALPHFFDERLTLGVGEDTELFERLRARGSRIVWCDEARVYDSVPATRVTWRWLLARGFRNGAARTHIERCHTPRTAPRRAWLRGIRHLLVGAARAATAPSKARRLRGLQIAATGVGRIAGLCGVR